MDSAGQAFFVHADTPWSLVVQCTETQFEAYLNKRQAQGFNTVMVNLIEHYFSSQSPFYKDVAGNVPFSGMTHSVVDFTQPVEAYWKRVDTLVNLAKARGMLVIAFPAYLGFGGGGASPNDQGWDSAVNNASDAALRSYGSYLANRYRQGNIVWAMGGDYNPGNPAKQWNIALGIRAVDANAVITAHGARGTSAYSVWAGQPGFNLNNIYCGTDGVSYGYAAQEYARPGPMPFFFIEGGYGNAETDTAVRRQAYQAILSGACGHCFGAYPVWGLGEPNANWGIGAASAISGYLDTAATAQIMRVKALFGGYAWHLLVPRTDGSLVSSALGSGSSRVCPALASDRSFAMVLTTGASITVNLAALGPSLLRARWFNPLDGTYSAASSAALANSGSMTFAPPGERVLVIDAT
ncbi:DUF4038 domain-containing protein [uncultured Piscinibacter sp.]|uniref:apiosidase-like domain-containing protein n=1 Tax=uncultured Piscinibacter sp. TaxID=1131835 RepID=UPI0026155FE6|nr:DUF4038 domain-containing protein [uncultured Piscinibacter sp.]